MQRERLTPDRIRKFTCPPGVQQGFLWDTEAPRLAVRATAAGSKAFIFESKLNRRTLRVTIGDVRAWGIEEQRDPAGNVILPGARQEARRLQTLVDQGTDPREQKAERAAAMEARRAQDRSEEAPALVAWDTYMAARTARWSPRTLLDHQRLVDPGGRPKTRGRKKGEGDTTQPGILRALLAQPLRAIDKAAVRQFLQAEVDRPTQAGNAFVRLRAFLNWAAEQPEYSGQARVDACASRMARDELPRRMPKQDNLQREMLRPWFAAVRALPNPVHAAYLQALLLIGARREELAALRWEDCDFQWRTLRIADKVEGGRTVPMTPFVSALLLDLKRRNDTPPPEWRIIGGRRVRNDLKGWAPSPWVFSSPTAASGRLTEPRISHKRALDAAGLPDLSLHGLRRSFGSLAEWVETPVGIVAQIQGHAPSALAEKHYRVRPIDLLRMWHSKIEAWILAEAGLKQPAEKAAQPARVAPRGSRK